MKGIMMNKNHWWLITATALIVGLMISDRFVWPQEGGTQVHWEYKVVRSVGYRNFKLIEKTLDEYGNDGWEVVDWEVDDRAYVFVLKR